MLSRTLLKYNTVARGKNFSVHLNLNQIRKPAPAFSGDAFFKGDFQ